MATLCKKNIEQTQEIQEQKQKESEKEPRQPINYKGERERRKRAKKRGERITSRESPSPRPIKKSPTKRSKQLIAGNIQILKSPLIPFLPNAP